MHIAEGMLPPATLAAGALLAAGGVYMGLRRIDENSIVKVAVLSSALFVGSLIHVPAGPASVHLLLNGLAGLVLGWAIFPSLATALLLQVLLFGYGGLTTLGVNVVILGTPGLCAYLLLNARLQRANSRTAFGIGIVAACIGVGGGASLLALALATAGDALKTAAAVVLFGHLPIVLIEGIVTGSAVAFLLRVRPELLLPMGVTTPWKAAESATP